MIATQTPVPIENNVYSQKYCQIKKINLKITLNGIFLCNVLDICQVVYLKMVFYHKKEMFH